jgi:hypothetical protein
MYFKGLSSLLTLSIWLEIKVVLANPILVNVAAK